MSESYDLCVIGCGPGGFAAAMRAVDLGKRVCVVEGNEIGGAGVMWGALASKTLWELSKDYAIAAKMDRGYRAAGLTVDYRSVRKTALQAVKEKQYQMLSQIETFSPRRTEERLGSVTLKRGWASFDASQKIRITYPDSSYEIISATHTLIATGSKPRSFPGVTVDQHRIFDSDGMFNIETFPERLMIIGAGVIGCEYATIFSNFAQTKVWLIDHQERIIPYEDEDVSEFVSGNLTKNGVTIIHSAVLKDILHHREYLEVILDFADGHSEVIEVDSVLISIGRVPDFSGLNLDAIGLSPGATGRLEIDENCRLKENIYAAGDVTHFPSLVNLAEMEARHAVEHMFGCQTEPLNYTNMSTVMFFYPEVAAVGLNEKNCRKKQIPYRVAYYPNRLVNRAIAMRSLTGFVKIIVSDDSDTKILGMRAAGPQASSSIMSIALFMEQGKGIQEALKTLYPHPTITEGIQECLRLLLGKSVYKPQAFPEDMGIRIWHPE